MKSNNAFFLSDESVTAVIDSKVYTRKRDQIARWDDLVEALHARKWERARRMLDAAETVHEYLRAGKTGATIRNGVVYMPNGEPIHGAFSSYILEFARGGYNVDHLLKCITRLQQNPSFRAREQLFEFVRRNQIAIHEDGRLVFYKLVNKDEFGNFWDVRTRSIRHNVGDVVTMPRSEVDDDPNRTCSHGLHVCTVGYLPHYGGDALMATLVDPADVVSIPRDYDHSKLRVCEHEVWQELDKDEVVQQGRDLLGLHTYMDQWYPAADSDDDYDPDEGELAEDLRRDDEYWERIEEERRRRTGGPGDEDDEAESAWLRPQID